jgi:head-tail adaptor
MRAGQKNHLITIQTLTTAKASDGSDTETWTDSRKVYAEIRNAAGKEIYEGGVTSMQQLSFRIDFISGLSPRTNRVVHNSENYDIISIIEIGRRQVTEIIGQAQGL